MIQTILTVMRKELKATLRDRRTLISAILVPAFAMPLLILGITKMQKSIMESERSKKLKVALYNAPASIRSYFEDTTFSIVGTGIPEAQAKDSVKEEAWDAVLVFDPAFSNSIQNMQAGKVQFYYKSTDLTASDRIEEKFELFKDNVLKSRFSQLNLDQGILEPLAIQQQDMASTQEQIGMAVGGFIPYIFILFCFIGCLYPTLDLITGEKEKGTIETLLTVPAVRFHILLGKMLTVALIGIISALLTIGGMFLTMRLSNEIPVEIMTTIQDILSLKFILMLFAMLIPLSLFFAGILSAVSIRAASFKEAQTYVTPMMFMVIVPAMLAMMPGMELTWQNVWIPIFNIALATKEIIAGSINNLQYIAIVISLIVLAVLAMLASRRQFSSEQNILK